MRVFWYMVWLDIKDVWLSVRIIARFGFREERNVSRSAHLMIRSWHERTDAIPSNENIQRLVGRLRLFEQTYKRHPNEQEVAAIVEQLVNFPTP